MLQQLTAPARHHGCFKSIRVRSARQGRLRVMAQQTGKRWDSEAETAAQVRRLIRRDKKEFLGAEDILQRYETEFGEGKGGQRVAADAASAAEAAGAPPAGGATAEGAGAAKAPGQSSLAAKAAAVAAAKAGTPAPPRFTGASAASPFGGASTSTAAISSASPSAASPFGASRPAASPFGTPPPSSGRTIMEPQGLSPFVSPDPVVPEKEQTFGSFISGITLTQVVIVVSFTTIISLMVATFVFVYNVGAIKLAGVD